MGFLPFLKVLSRDQRSHKATAVGSILGIMISVAFITASFMTTEMTLTELFQDEMEKVNHHFVADRYASRPGDVQNSSSQKEMMRKLNDLPGVQDSVFFRELSGFQFNGSIMKNISSPNDFLWSISIYGLDEGARRSLFQREDMVLPDDGRTVIISASMAKQLRLSIGDDLNLTIYRFGIILDELGNQIFSMVDINISFNISNIIEPSDESGIFQDYRPIRWGLYMSLEGAEKVANELAKDSGPHSIFYFKNYQILIKVDPDHFTNKDDVSLYRRELNQLKNDINNIIMLDGFHISTDNIAGIYHHYIIDSVTMRIYLVIFSFPLFLLCFYLVLVGSRTGMENKVQEISLLKVKGATKGQIFWMLFIESMFHGVLGALFGILLGAFLSLSSIYLFRGGSVGFFSMLPGGTMVLTLLLISCVLVSLIRLRSMLKLSKMDILQAVRGSPERKEKIYKPTFDLIVIAIMAFFLGATLFFEANRPVGTFQLVIYSIKEVASPLLIILLPFLLTLSLSRVMVLWVPQTISLVSKLFKGMNRELHSLLVSGMRFRKRQVAIMSILIAITISFGTLVLSQKETRTNGIDNILYSSIPSDLLVVTNGWTKNDSTNISSIEGVESVAVVESSEYITFQIIGNEGESNYAELIGFDVFEYLKIVNNIDGFFIEGDGLEKLSEKGIDPPVILNRIAAEDAGITIGDEISINILDFRILNCSVVGIVDHLPGLRTEIANNIYYNGINDNNINYHDLIDLNERPAIYISFDNVEKILSPAIWSYLVDIDGNKSSIIEKISSPGSLTGDPVIVDRETAKKALMEEPVAEGIDLMLTVQFAFVLITVVTGVFILQFIQNNSRRREFAEILSRGASKGNIFRLLLSEGLIVLILGLVIGSLTGLLVGYAFQTVFTGDWVSSIGDFGSNIDTENRITVENGVIFPPMIFMVHIVTVLSTMIAIVIVSLMTSNIDIASNLRIRRS